jgi:hypothetical protein
MNRIIILLLSILTYTAGASADNTDSNVYQEPVGTKISYELSQHAGTMLLYAPSYYGYSADIYVDGKTVYMNNLVISEYSKNYVKGEITEGDVHNGKISVATNQQVSSILMKDYQGNQYCKNLYYALLKVGDKGNSAVDKDAKYINFDIVNDTIKSDGRIIVITDDKGFIYQMGNDYSAFPADTTLLHKIAIPENMSKITYTMMLNKPDVDGKMKAMVKVARDGDDFYFYGLHKYSSKSYINPVKGTIVGDSIIITTPQYLGSYSNMSLFANSETGRAALYLDKNTGMIKCNDDFGVTMGTVHYINYLISPTLKPFTAMAPEMPEGVASDRYLMKSKPFMAKYGKSLLTPISIDGNDVYISNITNNGAEVLFKGTIKGDSIYVDYPQFMGSHDSNYYYLNLVAGRSQDKLDTNGATEAIKRSGTEHFAYNKNDGEISFDGTINILNMKGERCFSYLNPVFTVFKDTLAKIPEGAKKYEYTMIRDDYYAKNTIAIDGNDYYFMNVGNGDSTEVIKGTLIDGYVHVPTPQYVGGGNDVLYLCAGKPYKINDGNGTTVVKYTPDMDEKEIVLAINDKTGNLENENYIMYTYANGSVMKEISNLIYIPYVEKAATPLNPKDVSLWFMEDDDMNAYIGWNNLTFSAPHLDTESNYLDPEKMTYRIYFDGSLYTFNKDVFGLENDMWDIPYTYSDGMTFGYAKGTEVHSVLLKENCPMKKLGVQSVFHYDGKEYCSDIVEYDVTSTGIEENKTETAVLRTEYYDLCGRKINNPGTGLFIKKMIHQNGDITTEKVLKKD